MLPHINFILPVSLLSPLFSFLETVSEPGALPKLIQDFGSGRKVLRTLRLHASSVSQQHRSWTQQPPLPKNGACGGWSRSIRIFQVDPRQQKMSVFTCLRSSCTATFFCCFALARWLRIASEVAGQAFEVGRPLWYCLVLPNRGSSTCWRAWMSLKRLPT